MITTITLPIAPIAVTLRLLAAVIAGPGIPAIRLILI